jgi:hypothetical protein
MRARHDFSRHSALDQRSGSHWCSKSVLDHPMSDGPAGASLRYRLAVVPGAGLAWATGESAGRWPAR